MRFLPVIMLITFLNHFGTSVLFSPPAPLPWFIEHIAFEPVNLPSGVSVSFVTDESGRPSTEFIVFKNVSSIPLLVAGKPQDDYTEFDITSFEFLAGIGPLYKVVDGQAYVWRIKYNHPGTGYYYAWFREGERDDSIWLYVFENRIWCQNAIISDLEPRNQFGGDRPKDVQIPEPQHVVLSIIYGSEQIEIPITISYTLNAEYRSYANAGPDSIGEELFYLPLLVCFVSIVAILLIGAWINGRSIKK